MPSFDIVSKVDQQSLDNAINNARKEILNRYDFNGSATTVDLDKKTLSITIVTENEMRLKAVLDAIITRSMKQGIDPSCYDTDKEEYASGNMVRKEIKVKEGLDKETAKKISKHIKELKVKVDPSIMDDQVRVSGKKLDDLQAVISSLKGADFGQPLQYVNFK